MIHWTCDRCTQPVEGEPMTLLVNTSLQQERPLVAHLCDDCRASFLAWTSAAAPIEPTPQTTEAPPDGQ